MTRKPKAQHKITASIQLCSHISQRASSRVLAQFGRRCFTQCAFCFIHFCTLLGVTQSVVSQSTIRHLSAESPLSQFQLLVNKDSKHNIYKEVKKFIKYPDKEIFTYCYIKIQHVG